VPAQESVIPNTIATKAPSSFSSSGCFHASAEGRRAGTAANSPRRIAPDASSSLQLGNPRNAETLLIRADARILGATLHAGTTHTHAPSARFRHVYLAPAQGVVLVNGQRVAVGDGIAAIDEPELTITAEEDAEFILVDVA
jgi:redox-sensitive bicupin YhaK (pirin superfamily)